VDAVFLICSERCGSNLITRMVDNHPAFCGPSPTHLIRLLVENRHAYGDLRLTDNWLAVCQDAAELLTTKIGHWRTQPTAAELAEVAPRTLPALLRSILEGEALACGKSQLFVKENHAARLLPFLLTAWPRSRFVYLVRDPRDMALSWQRSPVHRGDVVRAARVWQADQALGIEAVAQLRDSGRLHLLSYEDLVTAPDLELTRLCRFLKVPFAPAMLAFHDAPTTIAEASRTAAWANLASPVLVRNIGKFRTALAPAEVALVEATCAREMNYFGYHLEATDPRSLAELEAELLPQERREKPQYRELPATERALRARRELLVRRMQARAVDTFALVEA
jgi:hypothetical protein